ncbi:MAG: hypothetical protein HLX50_06525 [Alteromonadaceae bacterium]|nr:hypothetical protein [Alteromonadaceae bacterium]
MSQNQQTLYSCSLCGTQRPASELNGLDPITGDNSHAYCKRVVECQSEEAEASLDWVIGELNNAEYAA